jgi:hypothetical protein
VIKKNCHEKIKARNFIKQKQCLNIYDKGIYRMLNKMQKTVCVIALLATTPMPALADSVDVRVIGTIRQETWHPKIVGAAYYDTIAANSLKKDLPTTLAKKTLEFTIACTRNAPIMFTFKNMRTGPLLWITEDTIILGNLTSLGINGGAKIGGYTM